MNKSLVRAIESTTRLERRLQKKAKRKGKPIGVINFNLNAKPKSRKAIYLPTNAISIPILNES